MADKKISDLTAATAIDDADLLEIENTGGNSRRIPASLIKPGWRRIGVYAPSAVASLNIENFAGLSNYHQIMIAFSLAVSTDQAGLNMRLKLNGSYKAGASDYKYTGNTVASPGTTGTLGSAANSLIALSIGGGAGGIGNNAVEGIDGMLTLLNPFETARWKRCRYQNCWIDDNAAQRIAMVDGAGAYAGVTSGDATGFALGGVQFLMSAGTMTGAVEVFGLLTG